MKGRQRLTSAWCWLWSTETEKKKKKGEHTDKNSKLAPEHKERQREDRTPRQTSCPQETEVAGCASSRLCPIKSHLTWLVFICTLWQPLFSACVSAFCFYNFCFGQRLLSCHVSSPCVRLSRLPSQSMALAHVWTFLEPEKGRKEVIHKVCGPSRGSRQIRAGFYNFLLSTLVLPSINYTLWETPTRSIP